MEKETKGFNIIYDDAYYIAIFGNCIWLYSDYFNYGKHLSDVESEKISRKMNESVVLRYEELKD